MNSVETAKASTIQRSNKQEWEIKIITIINNKFHIIGDFDLFMRLSQSWKFVFVNECLSCFRIHNENFSLLNTGMLIEELEKWISDVKIISNEKK